ncbi:hypothetical protein MNV49_002634 [Pseudohyphozyma bogoriensis]|nr:hypothetical protein MNV49_002634 [Pseudohyphozyma bogoriensis]
MPSKKGTKVNPDLPPPRPAGILSYFTKSPASAAAPPGRNNSTTSNGASSRKRKREIAVLDLADSDDDDIIIMDGSSGPEVQDWKGKGKGKAQGGGTVKRGKLTIDREREVGSNRKVKEVRSKVVSEPSEEGMKVDEGPVASGSALSTATTTRPDRLLSESRLTRDEGGMEVEQEEASGIGDLEGEEGEWGEMDKLEWGDGEGDGDGDRGEEEEGREVEWTDESMRMESAVEGEGGLSEPASEAEGDGASVERIKDELEDVEASSSTCPVCGRNISTLFSKSREHHVNTCLDGFSTTSAQPPTGFFPRLSSLFRSSPTPKPSIKLDPDSDPVPIASTSKLPSTTTSTDQPKRSPSPVKPLLSHAVPIPPKSTSSTTSTMPNAFTALMSGSNETAQWQEVDQIAQVKPVRGEKRKVPFYKWVDGMEITVDAFKYGEIEGCKAYFLSHAHSDHYQNLSASWEYGPIYCSQTTANLIKLKLKVKDEWVHPLPMDQTVVVHGINVTLIDANHCPGSVLFLFEGPHTCPNSPYSKDKSKIKRYLHCGDFRASPAHLNHPSMLNKRIDIVYLDTTYLDSKYCFPAQELVIEACQELVRSRVVDGDEAAFGGKAAGMLKGWLGKAKVEKKEEDGEEVNVKPKKKERLLVVVGTYSIGKERIVKGIAKSLETKIFCDAHKFAQLEAQDDPELHALLTTNPLEAQVHVVFLNKIKRDDLMDYLDLYSAKKVNGGFTDLIGLRPTGWTYRPENKLDTNPSIAKVLDRESNRKFTASGMYPQKDSTSTCIAYGVPYSEHSSFYE